MTYGKMLALALALGLALGGCSKEDPQAFDKVDHNKDGKVIFEELIVVFPDLTVEEFLAADADRNGALDAKEYQRLREARAAGKKLDASSTPPAPTEPAKVPEPAKAPEAVKPAEPVKAPEPAMPAEPAAPAKAPEAAAPAAPAAPAAATAQPTPPAEAEETVEVVSVAPEQAAAPARQTYTVARGDTLSRIAKKFGITPKDLMAANNMKNADHLEAGAEIVIPGKDGASVAPAKATPPAVAELVTGFFEKSGKGDVNGLLDYYGETVDYYKKGKSGKDIVRQDKADYFQRWPERSYTAKPAQVETLPGGDLRVTVPTNFTVKKGDKAVHGQAKFTFLLRPAGSGYRIVGEQSVVTERK